MTIEELEARLKEIDENFCIVDLTQHNIHDIVSIRYNEPTHNKVLDVCACPSKNIYEEIRLDYTDDGGKRHRTLGEIESICKGFIDKLKNDKDFFAYTVMTDDELDEYEKENAKT